MFPLWILGSGRPRIYSYSFTPCRNVGTKQGSHPIDTERAQVATEPQLRTLSVRGKDVAAVQFRLKMPKKTERGSYPEILPPPAGSAFQAAVYRLAGLDIFRAAPVLQGQRKGSTGVWGERRESS